MIWNTDEILLFIIGIVVFLIAIEIGFRFGRRYSSENDESMEMHVDSLQTAILGLLALLLGFTFAMAISRFDARKELVLEEANAIGATYLHSQFLAKPKDKEVEKLIKSYVAARLEFSSAGIDEARKKVAIEKAYGIEGQLWSYAVEAAKENRGPLNLFIQSTTNLININEKRRAALDNHVPEAVIALLFFVAASGMGFIGYSYGLKGKRRHGSTATFAFLIAVVLIIILDIDRPRRGFIQVSQASLIRLQESLETKNPAIDRD